MTTQERLDGSLTTDIKETMKVMIDYLSPRDEPLDNTDYHKIIRYQAKEPVLTMDDRDCSPAEVKNAINELNHKNKPLGKMASQEIYSREFKNGSRHLSTHYTMNV
jgi:hypothetical protein